MTKKKKKRASVKLEVSQSEMLSCAPGRRRSVPQIRVASMAGCY
jgi:hypothetical protein